MPQIAGSPGGLCRRAQPCAAPRSCCPKLHSGAGRSRPCPAPRGRARARCRQKRHRNGRWELAPGTGTGIPAERVGTLGREGWGSWARGNGKTGQGWMRALSNEGWEPQAGWDEDAGQGGMETGRSRMGILARVGWGYWLNGNWDSGQCGMQTPGRVERRPWARRSTPILWVHGGKLSPIPTWAAGAGPDAAGAPPGRPRPRPPLAFPPSPLRFHH